MTCNFFYIFAHTNNSISKMICPPPPNICFSLLQTSALQQHHLSKYSTSGPAQSFLTRQRQSTKARRSLGPQRQPR